MSTEIGMPGKPRIKWFRRNRMGALIIGAVLLLLSFSIAAALLARGPGPRYNYDRVQIGTTEPDIEAMWGPPVMTIVDPKGSLENGTPFIHTPNTPEGKPTVVKTIRYWWYDGRHMFEVYFDDRDCVIYKSSVHHAPPRSPVVRLWHFTLKPLLFESNIGRSIGWVPAVVISAASVAAIAWAIIRRRVMKGTKK